MVANPEKETSQEYYQIPSEQVISEAGELKILDDTGKSFPLRDLYDQPSTTQSSSDQPVVHERSLVIIIRHFFCGSCEEYVRALVRELPPDLLSRSSVKLSIIGCGQPSCIPDYKKRTNCTFDMYCDPTQAIYQKLGMVSNLKRGPKPDYITIDLWTTIWRSLTTALGSGKKGLQGGPASQNGGEMLFEGGKLVWFHRMSTTTDHAEVKELKEVLGIKE